MVDVAGLRKALVEKTRLSDRQLARLITAQESRLLTSRDMATVAVAVDKGVQLRRYVTAQELAELRALRAGTAAPAARSDAPAPQRPTARTAASSAAARPNARSARAARPKPTTRANTVMVIHGRNDRIRKDLFAFLRAIGLRPLEWNMGIAATKLASPTVPQIVEALFKDAAAAVVLLTPDDDARLRPAYRKASDHPYEKVLSGQARPNVIFEAGMAAVHRPNATVFVQVGAVKGFTDLGGIHITHLANTTESRQELATKLANANLPVDTSGIEWHSIGDFSLTEEELRGDDAS